MRKGTADNVAQKVNVEATLLRGRGRCGQMLRNLLRAGYDVRVAEQ